MSETQHLEKMIWISPEAIERFEACRFSTYTQILVRFKEQYPEAKDGWYYRCRSRQGLVSPQISCLQCPAFRYRKKRK